MGQTKILLAAGSTVHIIPQTHGRIREREEEIQIQY